jgi:hypothetical protein
VSIEILIGVVVGVIVAVLGGFALAEAKGWLPHLQDRLVGKAASKLPPAAQERYAEEWTALLADYSDRPITAFMQAVSLYLKAGSLAAELSPAPRAVKPSGEDANLPRETEKVRIASTAIGRAVLRFLTVLNGSEESQSTRWFSWLVLALGLLKSVLKSLRSAIQGVAQIPEGFALIFFELLEEATEGVAPQAAVRLLIIILRLGFSLLILLVLRATLGISLW